MREYLNVAVFIAVLSVLCYPVSPVSLITAFASNLGTQEEIGYTDIIRRRGYEERTYPSKNWVCTRQRGDYNDENQVDIFRRLFNYLGGENEEKRTLKMGIPASIEYEVVEDGTKSYTACFFLEEKDQQNYPAPTNSEVFIVRRPEMIIFTRKFSGYALTDDTWLREAASLEEIVHRAGDQTRPNIMYWNAYNSPLKFWNRRNEVWLVKQIDEDKNPIPASQQNGEKRTGSAPEQQSF